MSITPEMFKVALDTGITMPVVFLAPYWGKDEKTISRWAREGKIYGAYKHDCGEWWFYPQLLKAPPMEESNGENQIEGNGHGKEDWKQVLSAMEIGRQRRLRQGL